MLMLTKGLNKDDLPPLPYQSIARSPDALTSQRPSLSARFIEFSEGPVWSIPNDSNGSGLLGSGRCRRRGVMAAIRLIAEILRATYPLAILTRTGHSRCEVATHKAAIRFLSKDRDSCLDR